MIPKEHRYITKFPPGINNTIPDAYFTIDEALDRIKRGESKNEVEQVRLFVNDEVKRRELKNTTLVYVTFAGVFFVHEDAAIELYSGFMCQDFDKVPLEKMEQLKLELMANPSVYAVWLSPSGNGLKALILLEYPEKYHEHFDAWMEDYPEVDPSCRNLSRATYESYDPNIYINENAVPYTKLVQAPVYIPKPRNESSEIETESGNIIKKVLVWLHNKGIVFDPGQRHYFRKQFIFACQRYGVNRSDALAYCDKEYYNENSTQSNESLAAWCYDGHPEWFGIASFDKVELIEKKQMKENEKLILTQDDEDYYRQTRRNDETVRASRENRSKNGYPNLKGIGVPEIDEFFTPNTKDTNLIVGRENHGKSTFMNWYTVKHSRLHGTKWLFFADECGDENDFFDYLAQICFGFHLVPNKKYVPPPISPERRKQVDDFLEQHFKRLIPANKSIKGILELAEKGIRLDGIQGIVIDNFANTIFDDKMAEHIFMRNVNNELRAFSMKHDIYVFVIAHTTNDIKRDAGKELPIPRLDAIMGGTSFARGMDNILMYNRPYFYSRPNDASCQLYVQKVRGPEVGHRGEIPMNFDWPSTRYLFNGGVVGDTTTPWVDPWYQGENTLVKLDKVEKQNSYSQNKFSIK